MEVRSIWNISKRGIEIFTTNFKSFLYYIKVKYFIVNLDVKLLILRKVASDLKFILSTEVINLLNCQVNWEHVPFYLLLQTQLSSPGYSVKSIIDPTTCINMHNHFCWGFVYNVTRRNHDVDPEVAVMQHYKKCHFSREECRRMMNNTKSDNTVLKFRTELNRTVTSKLHSLRLRR